MTRSGHARKARCLFCGTSPSTWLLLALFLSLENLAGLTLAHAQYDPFPDVAIYPPAQPPADPRPRTRNRTPRAEGMETKVSAVDKAPAANPAQDAKSIVLLAGEAHSTHARSGEEMAALLARSGFKVEPRIGHMSLTDLGQDRRQADLAIVPSDALEDARRERGEVWAGKLAYVARLYNQEIHIVAHSRITSFADLHQRNVATSDPQTPDGRAIATLFQRAQIAPRLVPMDQRSAMAQLASGEIDAAILIGGKPVPVLADLQVAGLQLIAIPYRGALQEFYYPARIGADDYPHLVAPGREIDTIATGSVLVALDPRPNTLRHARIAQFTETLFDRFATLRGDDHHPKWREVNLAAEVPGWRRFAPAQKWLDRSPAPKLSSKP